MKVPTALSGHCVYLFLWIISASISSLAFTISPLTGRNGPRPQATELRESSNGQDDGDGAFSQKVETKKTKVVIVGGGWAGFSAADALASADPTTGQSSVDITILDGSPRGAGGLAGGWRTESGRPIEAGIHGFWREYRNTFAAVERIGLDLDEVLTPYTQSVLVSKSGRVALAPVLGDDANVETELPPLPSPLLALVDPKAFLDSIAKLLPPPLDIALASDFSPESPLNAVDRISALGLLGVWADFGQEDPVSWERYDEISAEDLFKKKAGVTDVLYDELITPLLHVLPMCPGRDCSAAAALSCFQVFALQSRGAFDVRWCRGSITEKIFNPWAEKLIGGGNVDIKGGCRVSSIARLDPSGTDSQFQVTINDGNNSIDCDAVIFAIGGTSMAKLTKESPGTRDLMGRNEFDKLRGVTCVAVRLWLSQLPTDITEAMLDSPVFVCGPEIGGLKELDETGFCIYDLSRLQDEIAQSRTAALEVDFFRADSIADMSDDAVVELTICAIKNALGTNDIDSEMIVDSSIVRARNAVSHFAVGCCSGEVSPPCKIANGIYMCGDWIDRSGHSSWSTEKAVVTGIQAIAHLSSDYGLICGNHDIIPAATDTEPLSSLQKVAKNLRAVVPPPGDGIPVSPLARLLKF